MPKFEYVVKDADGKNLSGVQEATDVNTLISAFREKGYLIIRVSEAKSSPSLLSFGGDTKVSGKRGKIKIDDLVIFSRQLATMVDAGVPLIQSLSILGEQSDNLNLKKVIADVHDSVEGGKSLSESLEKHKKVFSPLFVNMIKAGESSGSLDEILDRLATYIEKTSALQKKVKSAMVYPAVVSVMALIITMVMLTFVIPKFAGIFESLNAPLPAPTLILIGISNFLQRNILYVIAGMVGVFFLFNFHYI